MTGVKHLSQLMESLKSDSISKTINMLGLIHNTLKGAIDAKFYTDSWPNASAVVCELITPKISQNNGIFCYKTCDKAMCEVIVNNNLIVDNGSQLLQVSDATESKAVQAIQKIMDCTQMKKPINIFREYILPIDTTIKQGSYRCPPGYYIGKLEACHSEFIFSKWSVTESSSYWVQQYIENLESVALFPESNPTQPVSWALEFQSREIGHAYTLKTHRRKGFQSLVTAVLCNSLVKDCPDIPILATVDQRNIGYTVLEELGFMKNGFVACII